MESYKIQTHMLVVKHKTAVTQVLMHFSYKVIFELIQDVEGHEQMKWMNTEKIQRFSYTTKQCYTHGI